MHPRLAALPDMARERVEDALDRIREALDGEEYGVSTAERYRIDPMERIMALAAPRLRALVEQRGTPRPDGRTAVDVRVGELDLVLAMGTGKSGLGEDVPQLLLEEPREGYSIQVAEARFFFDRNGEPFTSGRGRLSHEAVILDALDAVAPMLPPPGEEAPLPLFIRFSAEAEMVRADGGFPGATCRAYLEALRDAVIAGSLAAAARQVPEVVRLQADAGYVWGERYLAYDDTDKRSCSVPLPGVEACLHENIDLIDDRQRWVLALERDSEGRPSRLSVWGHERWEVPTADLLDVAVTEGTSALGEPTLSLDVATGGMGVRAGTEAPGTLATNVIHGIERDLEAYRDLKATFKGIGVYERTDFTKFLPQDRQDELEGQGHDDEASSPSP